jgi:hypothetical protein
MIYGYSFSQEFTYLNTENIYKYEQLVYADSSEFHTSVKPYMINEIKNSKLLDSLYYMNNKNKFFDHFLNNNFLKFRNENCSININPILNLNFERNSKDVKYDSLFYKNSIGISLDINLKKKFALVLNFEINNAKYPFDANKTIMDSHIIPHFGKETGGNIISRNTGITGIYFLYYSGYFSYVVNKYIYIQAGIDKNFFGDGYRSLFLSDNSNAYPFLKTIFNLWKFKYLTLFSALKDINSDYHSFNLKEKYMSSHLLSYNVNRYFNVNLFETVVWRGSDSAGYRGFDVNYLNPVVVYRPVEYNLGSPDNVLMGIGARLKILKSAHLYSQLLIDEFNLKEFKKNNGWWGNKYGYQIGFKCYNAFTLNNLFVQLEYNYVRPYTYSHINSLENYGNYYQPLAHPMGGNFKETVCILRYRFKRISFIGTEIFTVSGFDIQNINYGQNIYLSYTTRKSEYGNNTTQGLKTELNITIIKISYLLNFKRDLNIEFGIKNNSTKNKMINKTDNYFFVGIITGLYNKEF